MCADGGLDDEAAGEKTSSAAAGGAELCTGDRRVNNFCGVRGSEAGTNGEESTEGGLRSVGRGEGVDGIDGRGVAVEKLLGVLRRR